jgi:hypothetical protein
VVTAATASTAAAVVAGTERGSRSAFACFRETDLPTSEVGFVECLDRPTHGVWVFELENGEATGPAGVAVRR